MLFKIESLDRVVRPLKFNILIRENLFDKEKTLIRQVSANF